MRRTEINLGDLYLAEARNMIQNTTDPYEQMQMLSDSIRVGDHVFASQHVITAFKALEPQLERPGTGPSVRGCAITLDAVKGLVQASETTKAHAISDRVRSIWPEKGTEFQIAMLGLGYLGVQDSLAHDFAGSSLHRYDPKAISSAHYEKWQLTASYLEAAALTGTDITTDWWQYGRLWAGLAVSHNAREIASQKLAVAYGNTGRRRLSNAFFSELTRPYWRARVMFDTNQGVTERLHLRHLAYRAEHFGLQLIRTDTEYAGAEKDLTEIRLTAAAYHAQSGAYRRAQELLEGNREFRSLAPQYLNGYLELFTALGGSSEVPRQIMNILNKAELSDEHAYSAIYRFSRAELDHNRNNWPARDMILQAVGNHLTLIANPLSSQPKGMGKSANLEQTTQNAKMSGGFGALAVKAAEEGYPELADGFLSSVTDPHVRVKTLIRLAKALGSQELA